MKCVIWEPIPTEINIEKNITDQKDGAGIIDRPFAENCKSRKKSGQLISS